MSKISGQTQVFLENVADISKLVFFVGAGVSVGAGYPLWDAATQAALKSATGKGLGSAAAAYAQEKFQKGQYYDVFEILQHDLAEAAFYDIAQKVFAGGGQPAETHRLLARVQCRGVITTNFDECLEQASVLEGRGIPLGDLPQAMASDKFFVLKPHGSIQVPRSMVLSRSDWKRVAGDRDFRELLAQCISLNQIVFMGYSMRDPDFNRMWDEILGERLFRAPAIYCCSQGALRPDLHEQFRQRNVQVVEFPDDGSFAFVPAVLHALLEPAPAPSGGKVGAQPEQLAQELERYVLISLQFSPTQRDRLTLVAKALVLEFLAVSSSDPIDLEAVFRHVSAALGQDSPMVRRATNSSVQELVEAKFLTGKGGLLTLDVSKLKVLNEQALKLETAQQEWVERALGEQSKALSVATETGDRAHVAQVVERVLMEAGKQVAELFLFNRPPKDESERIDEAVDSFCNEKGLAGKKELYKKTVKRMMFEPGELDEDILFKKLQSYFIASAYVLDPTSERLLSEYARDHWVYFDSSVILPALAVGHPSHQVYRRLLSRTQALGMRLRVIRDMVNEVWANVRAATAAFKEFSRASVSMQDVLDGYIAMHGSGNGNVFLEGMLSRLRLDPQLTAAAYMSEILGASHLNVNEEQVVRAISDTLGIDCDSVAANELDDNELRPIVASIEFLRKHAGRFKTQKLCEHEARQFYLIHLRRKQNPDLATKIWFVTTDRFLVELQRLEREKYPLPISYTPRSWFQYLDLIDVQSRGSRHFSRLQPRMRFGVVSGDLGIEAIQTILREQRDLLSKGVVTVKELAEAAVRDYHVRQSIVEYDKKSGSTPDAPLSEAKKQISREMKDVVSQFVAIRVQEIEKIKHERDTARADAVSLEKKLAKEKYIARTLKAQQKTRKGRPRKHP